jgi:hypothetical protein
MKATRCNIVIDGKKCGLKLTPREKSPGMFKCPLGHLIHIFVFEKKKKPKPQKSK